MPKQKYNEEDYEDDEDEEEEEIKPKTGRTYGDPIVFVDNDFK